MVEGSVYRAVVWIHEGRMSIGKLRRRWDNIFEMVVKEIELEGLNDIDGNQNRKNWHAFVKTLMNFLCSIKCEKFLDWLDNY